MASCPAVSALVQPTPPPAQITARQGWQAPIPDGPCCTTHATAASTMHTRAMRPRLRLHSVLGSGHPCRQHLSAPQSRHPPDPCNSCALQRRPKRAARLPRAQPPVLVGTSSCPCMASGWKGHCVPWQRPSTSFTLGCCCSHSRSRPGAPTPTLKSMVLRLDPRASAGQHRGGHERAAGAGVRRGVRAGECGGAWGQTGPIAEHVGHRRMHVMSQLAMHHVQHNHGLGATTLTQSMDQRRERAVRGSHMHCVQFYGILLPTRPNPRPPCCCGACSCTRRPARSNVWGRLAAAAGKAREDGQGESVGTAVAKYRGAALDERGSGVRA